MVNGWVVALFLMVISRITASPQGNGGLFGLLDQIKPVQLDEAEISKDLSRMKFFLKFISSMGKISSGAFKASEGFKLTLSGVSDVLQDPLNKVQSGLDKTIKGGEQSIAGSGDALGGFYQIGADGAEYFKEVYLKE